MRITVTVTIANLAPVADAGTPRTVLGGTAVALAGSGTDANGDLTVVWWVPSFGGDWRLSNFNQLFDGPRLEQGTLASYVTPWGGLNITGVDEDGRVVVYWWAPGLEEWSASPLSDLVTNVDPPVRNVNGHTSARGVITIVGQTELGQLVRYWWMPGGQWTGEAIELP